MTTRICGICNDAESKYKCPVCSIRYCSLKCFQTHKPQHPPSSFPSSNQPSTTTSSTTLLDRPGTTQRVAQPDFQTIRDDPQFVSLLLRYPLLQAQLQSVYGLTLEPSLDEAKSWHRRPLYGDRPPVFTSNRSSRAGRRGGQGRGRGGRLSRGRGRGDSAWSDAGNPNGDVSEDRPRGVWTQEKGDKEALLTIQRMRSGDEDDRLAEGIREFVELCQMRFGVNLQ